MESISSYGIIGQYNRFQAIEYIQAKVHAMFEIIHKINVTVYLQTKLLFHGKQNNVGCLVVRYERLHYFFV